jgi:hypothetical protein
MEARNKDEKILEKKEKINSANGHFKAMAVNANFEEAKKSKCAFIWRSVACATKTDR